MLRRLLQSCAGRVARTESLLDGTLPSTSGTINSVAEQTGAAFNLIFSRGKYTYKFKRTGTTPGLIFWKPQTPGTRHKISIDYEALGVYTGPPVKDLSLGVKNNAGRDDTGRVRVRGRGGGIKKVLRSVDYFRNDLEGVPGIIERLEHDPNRSGFLALTRYEPEGHLPILRYHVAPDGLKAGDQLLAGAGAPIAPGSVLPLKDIPVGVAIHNVELKPGKGGQLARAAATAAYVQVKQEDGRAVIKLPSGELRLVSLECKATVGMVSNTLNKLTNLGKAGESRKRGRRPITRGIAMNPVDHPHGGRTNGGRPSCTPWGVYCKGKRTRLRNRFTNRFILMRKGGQPIEKFINAKKAKPDRQAAGSGKGKSKAVATAGAGQKA